MALPAQTGTSVSGHHRSDDATETSRPRGARPIRL